MAASCCSCNGVRPCHLAACTHGKPRAPSFNGSGATLHDHYLPWLGLQVGCRTRLFQELLAPGLPTSAPADILARPCIVFGFALQGQDSCSHRPRKLGRSDFHEPSVVMPCRVRHTADQDALHLRASAAAFCHGQRIGSSGLARRPSKCRRTRQPAVIGKPHRV